MGEVVDLIHSLVPVAIDLAKGYAESETEEERDEVRRRAERETSDRLKLWDMAQATKG